MLNNNGRNKGEIKTKDHIAEHTAVSLRIASNEPSEGAVKEGRDCDPENSGVLMVFSV